MPHDNAPVTAEEREEIRELHCRTGSYLGNEGRVCEECLGDYPCLYVRTLDALEAAERRESALVAALREYMARNAHAPAGIGDVISFVVRTRGRWDTSGGGGVSKALLATMEAHDARRKGADHGRG